MKEKEVLSYEEALKILTTAEVRVLEEVEKGYSNKTIAKRLGLSIRTIHTHRNNMCKKIGISGNGGLLKWLYRVERGVIYNGSSFNLRTTA